MDKIFLIGFGRTGTKSIASLLKSLGYSILDLKHERIGRLSLVRLYESGDISKLFEYVRKYDVVEDHPWPLLYKELFYEFPSAKFILTSRTTESWIRSIVNHTINIRGPSENKRIIFGHDSPIGNEEIYKSIYSLHNQSVRNFFSDSEKFLEIDLTNPKCKEHLTSFLQVEIGCIKHINKSL